MKRASSWQGLGFGDEGKGATVDFSTREFAADLCGPLLWRIAGCSQRGVARWPTAHLFAIRSWHLGRAGDVLVRICDH